MQKFANKKLVEWGHLERFQKTYPEFPIGMICLQEQPDFVVKTIDGMLGIEVREWCPF